jgi:signal transduction histidine kinase
MVDPDLAEPRRVLLVDDDHDFADSLANLLRLEGCEAVVAYGFDEALEALGHDPPAVALVDIRLGRRDGVELVRELHAREPELTAVMMTAYASIETTIRALQAGAYDYLRKPFHAGELLATLARCFEHRRLRRERAQAREELARSEERLRQAQRMEAVGRIAGGVAHDFNNLLAVVLGNLRLIEEEVRDRPDLLELVGDALDATRSGVELTGRLLAFGRRQPLHPEPIDIAELALGFSRLLRRGLGEEVVIALDLAPDLWTVRVDRHQLETSLLNLAVNARDAMPGGGCLRIAARNAPPGESGGRRVALAVGDTGTGMVPEVRERATEPFFTTKPAGSGLGLFMVQGFVEQSGGRLEILSEPGRGTTVTLLFPAAAEAARPTAADPTDVAAPSGRGERVLLVEDQPRVRLLVRRQLARMGYGVLEAPDAATALRYLAEGEAVAALLTDIVLPGGMNGVELAEAALSARPGLGVVFTTGYAADLLLDRAGPLAAAPVLRKPVEPERLAGALRAAIDRTLTFG